MSLPAPHPLEMPQKEEWCVDQAFGYYQTTCLQIEATSLQRTCSNDSRNGEKKASVTKPACPYSSKKGLAVQGHTFILSSRNIPGQLKTNRQTNKNLSLPETDMLKPQNQPLNLTDGTPCQQTTMRFYKYEVLVKFLIY